MLKEEAGSSVCLRVKTSMPWLIFLTSRCRGGETKHCENEVGTLRPDIDRHTDRQIARIARQIDS